MSAYICCAGLAAIGLMRNQLPVNHHGSANNPITMPAPAPAPSNPPAREAPLGRYSGRETEPMPPANAPSSGSKPNPSPAIPEEMPVPPPLPPPREISPVPTAPKGDRSPQLDLSLRDDAIQVQRRLAELGFLPGSFPDGNWGPKSQQALIEFKKQARMGESGAWDAQTQSALFDDKAAHAISALSFIGGWTPDVGQCGEPSGPPPLRITANRAETDGGACQFNSVRPDGKDAWLIDALCSDGRNSHVAHIRLAVKGSVLQWTSEQPQTLYYRCQKFSIKQGH